MSTGSSSSRGGGLISSRVKCRCGAFAVVRMAKSGDNAGMNFFGCPNWPVGDCGFFQWVNVSNGVDAELRFKLFEKDTTLAEKEMEVDFMKEKLKIVEKKLDMKTEELNDTKMELSHTRIELMKATRNEKNFSLALFVSWIFFAMFLVYLKV
uniref:GRF-type domain-containing protein n=1 Tax=Chenopodium quinoa TaxID=63459 RepID=A0A803MES4_CHEQI